MVIRFVVCVCGLFGHNLSQIRACFVLFDDVYIRCCCCVTRNNIDRPSANMNAKVTMYKWAMMRCVYPLMNTTHKQIQRIARADPLRNVIIHIFVRQPPREI